MVLIAEVVNPSHPSRTRIVVGHTGLAGVPASSTVSLDSLSHLGDFLNLEGLPRPITQPGPTVEPGCGRNVNASHHLPPYLRFKGIAIPNSTMRR